MAPRYRWRDPKGRRTILKIVKKEIPEWKDGLHTAQLELIIHILDGEDVLCCMATGAGKSALFSVPIIILREMVLNPQLYPALPVRALPMGIVVTPTKGLAANIVRSLLLIFSHNPISPRFLSLRSCVSRHLRIAKIP